MTAASAPRRRGTAGLTLIEVMVAVTILAIVATLMYGGFAQTSRNKSRVERQTDRVLAITSTLERMSRELQSAYVSAQLNPSPSLQVVRTAFVGKDQGERDRLDFTSFAHQRLYRDAHESDQCELAYFLTRDPDARGAWVLARRQQSRVDDDPLEGGRVEVALRGVRGLQLEYFDPVINDWTSSWDTMQAAGQPNRLPAQVKIVLTVDSDDGRSTVKYATRVSLPIRWALNHATYNP
jgi:general secretion pathway protein J